MARKKKAPTRQLTQEEAAFLQAQRNARITTDGAKIVVQTGEPIRGKIPRGIEIYRVGPNRAERRHGVPVRKSLLAESLRNLHTPPA